MGQENYNILFIMSDTFSTYPKVELLSAWFCPYAQRAVMALMERCAPGDFTITNAMEINHDPPKRLEKIPLLLEKNPKGLVPVLIDRRGGEEVVVSESLICVEYIDEAMHGSSKSLLPGAAGQRAHARIWADKLNNEICTNFYTLLMKQDKESQDVAAEKILNGLRQFDKECKGPFFYGEDLSIVDITIAPWIVGTRMGALKHYRNFEVPKTNEYAQYWKWHDAVSKHPSYIATGSNGDLQAMLGVYLPYAEGTGFVRKGEDAPYCQKRLSSVMGKEKQLS